MTSKYKTYGKGWYNESERHRLARLGIKTSKVNYKKETGAEIAERKHPYMVGMTKGVLIGTFLQAPFGTVLGIPAGAYTAKKKLEREKIEREYQRKHKTSKFGRGWFRETERHRLARLGLKTGTKQKEKLSLIYKTPIPFVPMTLRISPGSKRLLGRRAKEDVILSTLKKRGWKVKYSEYPPPGQYELSKGKNYIQLGVTHWKKLKIDKVYIHDKDIVDKLSKLFRKPYPYKIKDYAKALAVFKDTKAKDTISYLGEKLVYRHTYNEDEFPDWSSDAQATIDSQKKRGKSVAVIHRGKYHDLYSEPINYAKITVENTNLNGSVVIDLDEIKRRHPIEVLKISNENYKELYDSGVKLKKNEDVDNDGVINIKDKKPLNPLSYAKVPLKIFKPIIYKSHKIYIKKVSGTTQRFKSKYEYKIEKNGKLITSDIGFSNINNVTLQAKDDIDKILN